MHYHLGSMTKTILRDNKVSQAHISRVRGSQHAKYTNHLLTRKNDLLWTTFKDIVDHVPREAHPYVYITVNGITLYRAILSSSTTGAMVRKIRDALGYTRREVATLMGVSVSSVNTLERTKGSAFMTLTRFLDTVPPGRVDLQLKLNGKHYFLFESHIPLV